MLADALQKGEKEEPGVHYKVDEKQKSVLMTDEGYEECEEALGVSSLRALLWKQLLLQNRAKMRGQRRYSEIAIGHSKYIAQHLSFLVAISTEAYHKQQER